jgi:hypothetical protein
MVLFESLRALISNLGMVRGFPKTLTKADFGITSDIPVTAGRFHVIGVFTVPPQQKYRWGIGNPREQENQGYMYVSLKSTASGNPEIKGVIRLVYSDANGLRKQVIYEERNEVLSASKTDRRLMKPLPETPTSIRPDGMAGEDDKLIIEYKPDSNDTISATASEILLPVTQF